MVKRERPEEQIAREDRNLKARMRRGLKRLVQEDPRLAALAGRHGLKRYRSELGVEPYRVLVRAVAHQLFHARAAEAILDRLRAHGEGAIPAPGKLLRMPEERLRECGFSRSKIRAVKDIALYAADGRLPDRERLETMNDDEIIAAVTPIYGVGRWTVEMLLIFNLGRLDVWPVDDLGVRAGYRYFQRAKELPTPKELRAAGEAWRPYRTLVSLLFWAEASSRAGGG